MTTQKFITSFNNGGPQEKARLLLKNKLKEPSQHLVIHMKEDAPYESFHILGFTQMRAGIWYAATWDGRRIPISAFTLYPSGERTFNEWAKKVPGKKFAEAFGSAFIEAFDNLVLPDFVDN